MTDELTSFTPAPDEAPPSEADTYEVPEDVEPPAEDTEPVLEEVPEPEEEEG